MPFGLPWSEQFSQQIADKADRADFVSDQVSVRVALTIRALREQAGLSQAELGKLAGTTQSAISRLEDPDSGHPSVTTLLKVSAALDVPLSITFPEWEDWFREGRHLRKADLQRRDFNGVLQAAAGQTEQAGVMRFPVGGRDGVIRATIATDGHEMLRIENVG